jgi:hypothetical protein
VVHDVKSHALQELRAIRATLERAATFTAVPGWGGVMMGISAAAAAAIAGSPDGSARWIGIWIADAIVACAIAVFSIARKVRRHGAALGSGGASVRRAALAYAPPIVAAIVLTVVFVQNGLARRLPGCWLLLYGASLAAGGALSVSGIAAMGALFMVLGCAAFAVPAAWGGWLMAVGFGGLHIMFGGVIVRRYGS